VLIDATCVALSDVCDSVTDFAFNAAAAATLASWALRD